MGFIDVVSGGSEFSERVGRGGFGYILRIYMMGWLVMIEKRCVYENSLESMCVVCRDSSSLSLSLFCLRAEFAGK